METVLHTLDQLIRTMPPITLADMKSIHLMRRTDKKFLTDIPTLLKLLQMACGSYYSQEIDGHRICSYSTTYWDDAQRHAFRMHETGHRPRRKVRVRNYLDSNKSFLEIKIKDNHDRTTKSRIPVPSVEAVINEHYGEDFLRKTTGRSFDELTPVIANQFNRITLVNLNKTERLTIDFNLHFHNLYTGHDADMTDIVIIELKRDGLVPSPILSMLRELRIKPLGFSKYCIGGAITNQDLRINRFKKRLIKIHKVAAAHK